jgi:predicted esterase
MPRFFALPALAAVAALGTSCLRGTDYLAISSEGFFHFPYRLYQPASATGPLPLIIFLPGAGESFPMYQSSPPLGYYNKTSILGEGLGGDSNGVTQIIDVALGGSFPAVVAVPQFLSQYVATGDGYHQWGHEPAKLNALVDYLRTTLPVDSRRVYLTGISSGSTGTWYALQHRPELYAAAVLASARNASATIWISPEPDLPAIDPAIVKAIPAWLFHGNYDFTIDADETRLVRNALVAAGGVPRFTEIAGMGHDGWENIYADLPAYTGHFTASTVVVPASAPSYYPPTPPALITMESTSTGLYSWLFTQERLAAATLLPRPQPGQKLLIDFGPDQGAANTSSPDGLGRHWNNAGFSRDLDYALSTYGMLGGVHSFGLVDATGSKTRVALRVLAAFDAAGENGESAGAVYPSSAQRDFWYRNDPAGAALRLEGLEPGALHRVKAFASRADGEGADRLTRYAIGSVSADLQVTNNTASVALLDEVESDSSGFLDLHVSRSPLRTGGNQNTYLGVMEIEVLAGPAGTYGRWAWDLDLAGAASDPAGDGDGDGLSNLLEYALGLDPHASDGSAAMSVAYNAATQQLTLSYPRLRADIVYSVETTTALENPASWTTVGVDQGFTSSTPLGGVVTASVPVLPGETRRFLRLRVTLP